MSSHFENYNLKVGQKIILDNTFSSGTGYVFKDDPYPKGIQVITQTLPAQKCCGFPNIQRWEITGLNPGKYLLTSQFLRPWDISTAQTFGAYITVE